MNESAIKDLKKNLVGLLMLGLIFVGLIGLGIFQIMSHEGSASVAAGFVYGLLYFYLVTPCSVVAAVYAIICTKKMAKSSLPEKNGYVWTGAIASIINFVPSALFLVLEVCMLIEAA